MKHASPLQRPVSFTGNSARSIMAEAIMKRKGVPNFTAYSAGSHPAGFVRPEALHQIERARLSSDGLRSKSWTEFTNLEFHSSISFSPSAIMPPRKSVQFGLASP